MKLYFGSQDMMQTDSKRFSKRILISRHFSEKHQFSIQIEYSSLGVSVDTKYPKSKMSSCAISGISISSSMNSQKEKQWKKYSGNNTAQYNIYTPNSPLCSKLIKNISNTSATILMDTGSRENSMVGDGPQ
jgi:hypothetical protein